MSSLQRNAVGSAPVLLVEIVVRGKMGPAGLEPATRGL